MPRSQGVISFAHHSAKAEVRGANPRESSNFIASVPQQSQDEFSKLVIVGASPATDARWLNAICPRSSVRSERHRAKVEVAGAIPAVDAILNARVVSSGDKSGEPSTHSYQANIAL